MNETTHLKVGEGTGICPHGGTGSGSGSGSGGG